MLTPEKIKALEQASGMTYSQPNAIPSGKSRADEIRSMAQTTKSQPVEQNYLSRVKDTVKQSAKEGLESLTASAEGTMNPLRAGANIAKNVTQAAASPLAEIPVLKQIGEKFGEVGQKIVETPIGEKVTDVIAENVSPENLSTISDVAETGLNVLALEGGVKNLPKTIENTKNTVKNVTNKTLETAKNVKEKISPTETPEQLTGKVLQGKTKDIASGQSGLSQLDTSKVKTYKDLNKVSSEKIKELSKAQDKIMDGDTRLHKVEDFVKQVGEGDNAVRINYVKEAIDNLKELYQGTRDAKGMVKINEIESKLNSQGLTTKEVNNLAREYGSEFGSKAFGKTGEPLTGINPQRFENTRTGLKETAREFLPDDVSRQLDSQMSDLYTVKDLSGNMAEKVNTLSQRLQNVNFLQKIGSKFGKALRITGIGDLASKLLGIDKVPGAATLNAVELQAQLSKNLSKINKALEGTDAQFIDTMKEVISDFVESN